MCIDCYRTAPDRKSWHTQNGVDSRGSFLRRWTYHQIVTLNSNPRVRLSLILTERAKAARREIWTRQTNRYFPRNERQREFVRAQIAEYRATLAKIPPLPLP